MRYRYNKLYDNITIQQCEQAEKQTCNNVKTRQIHGFRIFKKKKKKKENKNTPPKNYSIPHSINSINK